MEGESQELETVSHSHDGGLGLGHLEPDIAQNRTHQVVGSLDLAASVSQNHEVIGVMDQPKTGCPHLYIEPVEVDVGQQR